MKVMLRPFSLNKPLSLALVLALLGGVIALVAPAAASNKVLWVDDDGFYYSDPLTGASCDGFGGEPGNEVADSRNTSADPNPDDPAADASNSIQNAVNKAHAGDTINVCPGIYSESVTIPHDRLQVVAVEMQGQDARGRVRLAPGGTLATDSPVLDQGRESIVRGKAGGTFIVQANNVRIDGFLLEQCSCPAVYTDNAKSGHTIINNIFLDNSYGIDLASSGTGGPGPTPTPTSTVGPTPAPTQQDATATVARNVFIDNNRGFGTVGGSGNGIYSDRGLTTAVIRANWFSNNRSAAINVTSGVAAGAPTAINDGITIRSNLVDSGRGIALGATGNSFVIENSVLETDGAGITLDGSNTNLRVAQNISNDNTGPGIELRGFFGLGTNTATTIVSNEFLRNSDGIVIRGAATDGSTANGFDPTGSTIAFNRMSRNRTAGIRNESAVAVTAENNWWGCNEGPGAPDCDTVVPNELVDFRPWLILTISSEPDDVTPGNSAVIFAAVTQNSNNEVTQGQGAIREGTTIQFFTDRGDLAFTARGTENGVATTSVRMSDDTTPGPANVEAALDRERVGTIVNMGTGPGPSPGIPGISIGDVTIYEGNSGFNDALFTVRLSSAPQNNETVRVSYSTLGVSATEGEDFVPQSGTLEFTNNFQTEKQIRVPLVADTRQEPDEFFFVNLTNAQNAQLVDDQGMGTILNDDSGETASPSPTGPSPSPTATSSPTATQTARPTTASPRPTGATSARSISLTASKSRKTFGQRFTLAGTLSASDPAAPANCTDGVSVAILRDVHGDSAEQFVTYGSATTGQSGAFSASFKADQGATYIARVVGNSPPGCGEATSEAVPVLVRAKVRLRLSDKSVRPGQRVRLKAVIVPCLGHSFDRVTLLAGSGGSRLGRVASDKTDGSCRARFTRRVRERTIFQARWAPQDDDHLRGISRRKTVVVRR